MSAKEYFNTHFKGIPFVLLDTSIIVEAWHPSKRYWSFVRLKYAWISDNWFHKQWIFDLLKGADRKYVINEICKRPIVLTPIATFSLAEAREEVEPELLETWEFLQEQCVAIPNPKKATDYYKFLVNEDTFYLNGEEFQRLVRIETLMSLEKFHLLSSTES